MPTRPRKYLIIDGYNVIRQTPPYRALAERDDFELACEALIADVGAGVASDTQTLVVFDGTGNPHSTGDSRFIGGVEVVYSAYGIVADSVIERRARILRDKGAEVEVVTSDAQLQWTVMGETVTRRSSREFAEDLGAGYREFCERKDAVSGKVTLDDRISPEARDLLRRIRDCEE